MPCAILSMCRTVNDENTTNAPKRHRITHGIYGSVWILTNSVSAAVWGSMFRVPDCHVRLIVNISKHSPVTKVKVICETRWTYDLHIDLDRLGIINHSNPCSSNKIYIYLHAWYVYPNQSSRHVIWHLLCIYHHRVGCTILAGFLLRKRYTCFHFEVQVEALI